MKFSPYSFSRLNTHDQCNRRFKYNYIDKLPREPTDMTALLKGGAVHSILEHYPEKSTHKLAHKYQAIANNFIESDLGNMYLTIPSTREHRFGLTETLEPCDYSDKTAMFRGAIDYVSIIGDVLQEIEIDSLEEIPEGWELVEIIEE